MFFSGFIITWQKFGKLIEWISCFAFSYKIPVGSFSEALSFWKKYDIVLFSGCVDPLSACEKFSGTEKGTCYGNIAANQNDSSICNKLTGQDAKDYCFATAAYVGKNRALCANVQNSDAKQNCYNQIPEQA